MDFGVDGILEVSSFRVEGLNFGVDRILEVSTIGVVELSALVTFGVDELTALSTFGIDVLSIGIKTVLRVQKQKENANFTIYYVFLKKVLCIF